MAYQRGSLKKVKKKGGVDWVLRYRVGGKEQTPFVVGLVADFPTVDEAELEVDRLRASRQDQLRRFRHSPD